MTFLLWEKRIIPSVRTVRDSPVHLTQNIVQPGFIILYTVFKASSGMIDSQFPGILSSIVCRTILNQNGTKCTLHSVLPPQSTQDNLFDIVNSIPPDRVAVIEWAILPWNHFRKRTNLPMMNGLGLFFHESPSSEHIYLNTSSRREIVWPVFCMEAQFFGNMEAYSCSEEFTCCEQGLFQNMTC